jgi:hypothetical protein
MRSRSASRDISNSSSLRSSLRSSRRRRTSVAPVSPGQPRSAPVSLVCVLDGVVDDVRHVPVGHRVDGFTADARDRHETRGPQDPEVLRHERLRETGGLDESGDARLALAEQAEQSESRRRRERLEQLGRGLEGVDAHARHISARECDEGPA